MGISKKDHAFAMEYDAPRNRDRAVFEHEIFVPHPYAIVDPPSYDPRGSGACSPRTAWPTARTGNW